MLLSIYATPFAPPLRYTRGHLSCDSLKGRDREGVALLGRAEGAVQLVVLIFFFRFWACYEGGK